MAATQKDPGMTGRFQSLVVDALNAVMTEMCGECRQGRIRS